MTDFTARHLIISNLLYFESAAQFTTRLSKYCTTPTISNIATTTSIPKTSCITFYIAIWASMSAESDICNCVPSSTSTNPSTMNLKCHFSHNIKMRIFPPQKLCKGRVVDDLRLHGSGSSSESKCISAV